MLRSIASLLLVSLFSAAGPSLAVFIPDGRPVDPVTGTNWEGVGIAPDIQTDPAQALTRAHRVALEELLAGAATKAADAAEWKAALDSLPNAEPAQANLRPASGAP